MTRTGTVMRNTMAIASVRMGPVSWTRPMMPLVAVGVAPAPAGRAHVISTVSAFQTVDSQKPTQTQPPSPTQNCDGFVIPSVESLKLVFRQRVHVASFGSQYVVLADGK